MLFELLAWPHLKGGSKSIFSAPTKGRVHVPGRMEWDGRELHYGTQNGAQAKICQLFISGTFHLISLDPS